MDIHRCRFVPYKPQSINALAFSHPLHDSKTRAPADLRLALGRENGDVEIWNPVDANWVQERVLRGSRDRTIEQLQFTQELVVDEDNKERPTKSGAIRLFSSGGSALITEWSLSTGAPVRNVEGNAGHIWCFAAQPQWKRSTVVQQISKVAESPSQLLAAGSSDGSVILFSTADDDLQYLRVVAQPPAKRSKVLSIAWRDRNTIIAGYENSFIRVIDVPSRKVLRTMNLGKSGDTNSSLVWAVRCLPDGTILSGDSSGELKVWDAENYSLVQRLKIHEADILDIATSAKGDMIFTTGVDRKTVNYRLVSGQTGDNRARWQQVVHRRYHRHDVKALAAFESKDMSVLVSGGVDTTPVILPLRNFDTENHRQLTHLPQKPQMSCSTRARLMLSWWDQDMFIFHLPRRASEVEAMEDMLEESLNHKLVARIQLRDDENITSAQISDDGRMIVAATAAGVKLFQLRKRVDADTKEIEVRTRPIELPFGIGAFGAITVGFSPDNKWLYSVRSSNVLVMAKIVTGASSKDKPVLHEKVIKLGRKARQTYQSKLGNLRQFISCVSFSSDSRILATGDLSGAIDAWILEGHEDLNDSDEKVPDALDASSDSDSDSDSDDETDSIVIHGQKWVRNPAGSSLPQLDSAIIALSFKPQPQHVDVQGSTLGLHATRHTPHPISHEYPTPDAKLIAVTSSHSLVEFDVLSSRLSDWSRRNPSSFLPAQFTQVKDRTMGAFWDCSPISTTFHGRHQRLWLYGPTWLFMLDMSHDLNTNETPEKIGKLGKYDVKEPAIFDQKHHLETSAHLTSKKRKRNTGAGDKMKEGHWQFNQGPIHSHTEEETSHPLTPTSNPPDSDSEMDTDTEPQDSNTLTLLRRNNPHPTHSNTTIPSPKTSSPQYYSTFRYRSIYGIAVLSPSPSTETSLPPQEEDSTSTSLTTSHPRNEDHKPDSGALEIIIVERPLYDIDLVPRMEVGTDWNS